MLVSPPPDRDATAGWVNIRKEGFPWRHMVSDAEQGLAEVSRVGRKLMARETEVDRWLSTRDIRRQKTEEADAVPHDHPSGCDCAACTLRSIRSSLRRAGVDAPEPTAEEIKAFDEERKSPEHAAELEARYESRERASASQAQRKAREEAERIPRQEAALAYLKTHRALTAEAHCKQHRVKHWYGYRDLNALVEAGKLLRTGAGPKAVFFLPKERT